MQVSIDTAVLRCKVMKVHILDLATELNRRSRHEGGTGLFVVSADGVCGSGAPVVGEWAFVGCRSRVLVHRCCP